MVGVPQSAAAAVLWVTLPPGSWYMLTTTLSRPVMSGRSWVSNQSVRVIPFRLAAVVPRLTYTDQSMLEA